MVLASSSNSKPDFVTSAAHLAKMASKHAAPTIKRHEIDVDKASLARI